MQKSRTQQKALILQSIGISYRQMNKPQEAMKIYLDSMEISKKLGLKRLLANNLAELAAVQITLGKPDAAMTNYGQSLELLREIGTKKECGDILINRGILYEVRGDYDKALLDYKDALQIQRDAGDESYQALCLSNIGNVYLGKGDTENALTYLQQSLELRRKLNVSGYLALTLRDLGETYFKIGDYDKALSNLTMALEVSRKTDNASATASTALLIGSVLVCQGRLGAAVSAMKDSVSGYRAANNRSIEMAYSLNSLADTLALVGRGRESGKLLDEAQGIARNLKNDELNRGALNSRGDVAFYQDDLKAAKSFYEQEAVAASKGKQRDSVLLSKMNLARLAIAEGHAQSAIGDLRTAIQLAGTLHLKYYGVRSTVDLAQALINAKDYEGAYVQLDSAQGQSEKLGLRLETARIHYFRGEILRLRGNAAEATGQYQQAKTMLDDIKKEPGAEHLLDRFDLRDIYTAASGRLAER